MLSVHEVPQKSAGTAVLLLALANCSESNDRSEGCLGDPLTTFADGKSGLGMTCLDYATALGETGGRSGNKPKLIRTGGLGCRIDVTGAIMSEVLSLAVHQNWSKRIRTFACRYQKPTP